LMQPRAFSLMDMLLLTASSENPWDMRSTLAIEEAIKVRFRLRMCIREDQVDRLARREWLRKHVNDRGFVFVAPTREGAAQHFQATYRVTHLLERDRPFAGGTVDALAQWFDQCFSPKSNMNARLDETGIPGACLGPGTKWREAAALLQEWNTPPCYSYISALIVHLLDPEQWPNAALPREAAWAQVEDVFRPTGLRLDEAGCLVPALRADSPAPRLDVWDDEACFRQELVEPLLRRLPGVINVICTHGNDEFGRDFLFDYRHPLGHRRWVAVQVKSGDVSGEAGKTCRVILDQVHMAFEHPIIDLGSMGQFSTSEVIVLISGNFKGNARERILDGIRDPAWRANTFFFDRAALEGITRDLLCEAG